MHPCIVYSFAATSVFYQFQHHSISVANSIGMGLDFSSRLSDFETDAIWRRLTGRLFGFDFGSSWNCRIRPPRVRSRSWWSHLRLASSPMDAGMVSFFFTAFFPPKKDRHESKKGAIK